MTTPPIDLPALKEIAKAAHGVLPAPWVVMNDNNVVSVVERSQRDGSIIAGGEVAEAQTTQFRDHIAAFDPPTVLALLDRVTAAESSLARYIVERTRFGDAMAANAVPAVVDAIMRELTADSAARAEAAEKAVAAVREALEAHPKACDRHTEDDPIKCGWKRAVADVTRALDGGA